MSGRRFFEQHHVGDVLHGKVLRLASFGAFVEIAEGIEGLCHNSEAVDANGQPMTLEPGQEYDFKIIKMNPEEKKVGLEHSRSRRGSHPRRSGSLQAPAVFAGHLDDRRADGLEARFKRVSLTSSIGKAAAGRLFCDRKARTGPRPNLGLAARYFASLRSMRGSLLELNELRDLVWLLSPSCSARTS